MKSTDFLFRHEETCFGLIEIEFQEFARYGSHKYIYVFIDREGIGREVLPGTHEPNLGGSLSLFLAAINLPKLWFAAPTEKGFLDSYESSPTRYNLYIRLSSLFLSFYFVSWLLFLFFWIDAMILLPASWNGFEAMLVNLWCHLLVVVFVASLYYLSSCSSSLAAFCYL